MVQRERQVKPSRRYLAVHDVIGSYRLICVECPSAKVIWKTDVWGSFWGGLGGFAEQWVEVTEQNSRVIVFGCGIGIHCEAFRSDDGTSVFRFSNGYAE